MTTHPRRLSWSKRPGSVVNGLPFDLTGTAGGGCGEQDPRHGWGCTREPAHTGRHAAGDGGRILACWWSR